MSPTLEEPFHLPYENTSVAFTWYYYLGGRLRHAEGSPLRRRQKAAIETIIEECRTRDWWQSELAHYVSNNFMEVVLLDHFHLVLSEAASTLRVSVGSSQGHGPRTEYAFRVRYEGRTRDTIDHESIGGIECDLFNNGYLAVTVHLQPGRVEGDKLPSEMYPSDLCQLIRHPEVVRYQRDGRQNTEPVLRHHPGLDAGELVCAVWNELVPRIEALASKRLAELCNYLERLTLAVGSWSAFPAVLPSWAGDDPHVEERGRTFAANKIGLEQRRTRMTVGVQFGPVHFDDDPDDNLSAQQKRLRQFVVAVGRTTPAFRTTFEDPKSYLENERRNAYGPGGSIVFVGRRGWCVYDYGEQDASAFQLGVVETTSFVIRLLATAARSRRWYARLVAREGIPVKDVVQSAVSALMKPAVVLDAPPSAKGAALIMEKLRAAARQLVVYRRKIATLRDAIATATDFLARASLLAPDDDMSVLLESHLSSHTGRAVADRCRQILSLDRLSQIGRDLLSSYAQTTKTSSDYLAMLGLRIGVYALVATVIAIVMSTL